MANSDRGELPPIVGSEGRLGQVFLNVLVNAAQALPGDGVECHTIRVTTRTDPRGRALVEIADDGPGIAPDVLARVFEPFFTTKPAGVGTGLGLAICQQILTAMGGDIAIESALGKGTTVSITLPPSSSGSPSWTSRIASSSRLGLRRK